MAPDIQERGKRKRVLIGAEYTSEYKNILFHFEKNINYTVKSTCVNCAKKVIVLISSVYISGIRVRSTVNPNKEINTA